MLRKKLSKLIVAVMAAVMLSGGMSGVGQVAFANSNVSVVAQNSGIPVTDETTMLTALNDPNNENVALKLEITTNIVLTENLIKAINDRKAPLTIEFGGIGALVIDATTSAQAVSLIGNDKSLLKMVRGTGKTGEMLVINNNPQMVTIENVTFENGNNERQSVIKRNGQGNVTLSNNHLQGEGALLDKNGGVTGVTFLKNILNQGKLLSDQTLDITFNNPIPGSTAINFSGSIDGTKGTRVNIKSGKATITVKDPSASLGDKEVPVTLNVAMNNGVFTGATFSAVVDGLEVNKQYDVELVIEVTDGSENEYVRVQKLNNPVSTINFSTTYTNVTNNSATINITHGTLPNNVTYPLDITLTPSASVPANPTKIESTTNTVSLTGLAANTSYTYEIKDTAGNVIDRKTFTTTSSTITGGGSTGGSVVSGDITTSDINRADIKDISVSIPVGSTTLANSLRDGRDYKTNIEGVTVTYSNGKVEFTGLVPEKDYRDLTITYTDKDGRTRTVKVPSFKTKVSETKLRQFIVDVYRYSLDRVADERGFAYWEDQLKNKKTSPDEFVKNLLNEREFINKHTTTTAKIEGLYQVIVNRKSDSQGLSFWTKKYDDLVARGYSESMALRVIVDEMVNEQEFKNRVRDLGL